MENPREKSIDSNDQKRDALSERNGVTQVLTAPIYSLSRPMKKYKLSNKKKPADYTIARLYERSKELHHALKTNPLQYLEASMKDLDLNYTMFEKVDAV